MCTVECIVTASSDRFLLYDNNDLIDKLAIFFHRPRPYGAWYHNAGGAAIVLSAAAADARRHWLTGAVIHTVIDTTDLFSESRLAMSAIVQTFAQLDSVHVSDDAAFD